MIGERRVLWLTRTDRDFIVRLVRSVRRAVLGGEFAPRADNGRTGLAVDLAPVASAQVSMFVHPSAGMAILFEDFAPADKADAADGRFPVCSGIAAGINANLIFRCRRR